MDEITVIQKGICRHCKGGTVNGPCKDGKFTRVPCKVCRGTRFNLVTVDIDTIVLASLKRLEGTERGWLRTRLDSLVKSTR